MTDEPCGQPTLVLSLLSFAAGAAVGWFAVCRPLIRWLIGTHLGR